MVMVISRPGQETPAGGRYLRAGVGVSLSPARTTSSSPAMSFSAFKASLRKAPVNAARPARAFRTTGLRRYTTEVPKPEAPKKSNTALYAGIGAAAVGGIAFYIYTSNSDAAKEAGTLAKSGAQAVKVAANFVPTKEDYEKVCDLKIHRQSSPFTQLYTGLQQNCRSS